MPTTNVSKTTTEKKSKYVQEVKCQSSTSNSNLHYIKNDFMCAALISCQIALFSKQYFTTCILCPWYISSTENREVPYYTH